MAAPAARSNRVANEPFATSASIHAAVAKPVGSLPSSSLRASSVIQNPTSAGTKLCITGDEALLASLASNLKRSGKSRYENQTDHRNRCTGVDDTDDGIGRAASYPASQNRPVPKQLQTEWELLRSNRDQRASSDSEGRSMFRKLEAVRLVLCRSQ